MPSDKQTRRQRHQAAVKPQRGKAVRGAQSTEFVKGAGFRKSEFVGGKKYYTPMSTDPKSSGAGGDVTNITLSGSSGVNNAVLSDGTVPFSAKQLGVPPTESQHLATKGYVDDTSANTTWTLSDGTTTQAVIGGNTVTVVDGTAINAVVSATDTLTINNTGVTSNVAGTGIGVSGATGAVTINNTGVTSNIASTGVHVSSVTGDITITNTGVISNVAGSGISVSSATGDVTVANTGVLSATGTSNEVDISASTGNITIGLPNAVTVATSLTTPRIISSGDITLEPAGADVLPLGNAGIDMGDYNRMWRTLYASELYVETLVAQDVLATIGGRIMVAPTTKLIADLSSGATTIDVEHNNITGKYVIMKTAPGGVAQTETFKISGSSPSSITGGYRYNITSRNLDGTGANAWVEGDAACSVGGSVGEGFMDLTSTSTVLNHAGPTMAIYARTGGSNWNDLKPTVAVGQLSSFVDYSGSDKFGIAIGNDITLAITNGFKGLTADNTNGLRMFNTPIELYSGAEKRVKISSDGTFKIGRYIDNSNSGTENNHLYWNGTSLTVKGDIEMGSGSTINWGNVTESGTVPYRANNWSPDLTAYATNSALSSYALTSSLSAYMQVTPSSSTNIGANYVYTGTLIAGQVNAVAINADSISAGTLAAARISAGSIRTNKLTAGGANLVPSPALFTTAASLEAEGWTKASTRTELRWENDAFSGSTYRCIEVGGYQDSYGSGNQSGNLSSPLIPIDTSQTYRLKLDIAHETGTDTDFGIQLRFYTSNGISETGSSAVNADGGQGSPATGITLFYVASGYITSHASKWVHIDRVLFPASATQTLMRGGGNLDEQDVASEVGITGSSAYYTNNCKMPIDAEYVKIFIINEPESYYQNVRVANISLTAIGEGLGVITGSKIQTSSTGKRIIIDGDNNNIKFYDGSNNQVCRIDDDVFSSGGNDYPGLEITSDRAFFRVSNANISEGYMQFYNEMRSISIPTTGTGLAHYSSITRDGAANNPNSSSNIQSFYADARNDGSGSAYGMYIAAGLAAKPSGGSWASASDSRVKTIGDNYITGLTELAQLQPKYYKYNGKADGAPNDGVDYVGLIAQEAETVIPSLVSQGKGEIDSVEVDDFRMLDTSELQYAIINAVKELNTRLIALEG